MYVDDAERSAIRFDHGADINAAPPAKKKVCCFQAEAVTLQKPGIATHELDSTVGI
jgi:hypothetical protein